MSIEHEPSRPRCPKCGYDVSGTRGNVCPECGTGFDRSTVVFRMAGPRAPGASALLLCGSIFGGMIGYGFSPPNDQLYGMLWFFAVWAFALVWAFLNRRVIAGPKPHWALWLVLVAVVAVNRPNLRPPGSTIAATLSLAGGVSAAVYALARAPRAAGRGLLLAVTLLLWLGAAILLVAATCSQLGLTSGGSYGIMNQELATGGINDGIAAGFGVILLIAGFAARAVATHLSAPISQRSQGDSP